MKGGISLYGSSVRGTCRRGYFAKGPDGYERKSLGMGISLHGGSTGQLGVDSSTTMVERGSGGGVSLSVGAL